MSGARYILMLITMRIVKRCEELMLCSCTQISPMGVHVVNGAGHDIKKRSNTIDSSTFGILGYTSFITYCRSEISKWEFRMSHDAFSA